MYFSTLGQASYRLSCSRFRQQLLVLLRCGVNLLKLQAAMIQLIITATMTLILPFKLE